MTWILLLARSSLAHDLAGERAIAPLVPGDVLVGARTTSGLLTPDGSGWGRVCNESLPDTIDLLAGAEGTVLRATATGVFQSSDHGCSFDERPWLDLPVSKVAVVGSDLLLVVPDPDGDRVLVSVDGALPFEAAPLPVPTRVSSTGGGGDGSWWVSGLGPTTQVLARSVDRGDSWETVPPPDLPVFAHQVLGPAGDTVFVASSVLFGATRISSWNGAEFTPVIELPLLPVGAGCAGAWCFAATGGALFRWEADGDPTETLALADGPTECLVTAADGTLWGCWSRFAPALLASTTDGETWTDAVPATDVHERTCPAGTLAGDVCPKPVVWPEDPGPGPVVVSEGPIVPGPSEGCGNGRASSAIGLLGLLRAFRRPAGGPGTRPRPERCS